MFPSLRTEKLTDVRDRNISSYSWKFLRLFGVKGNKKWTLYEFSANFSINPKRNIYMKSWRNFPRILWIMLEIFLEKTRWNFRNNLLKNMRKISCRLRIKTKGSRGSIGDFFRNFFTDSFQHFSKGFVQKYL